MKASLDYIQQKFIEYNRLCFDDELPLLPFKLSNARTFLGQLKFTKKRNLWGKWHYQDFVFCINTAKDMPEELLEDTILHEMIHYYILYHQLHDSSAHGKLFVQKMNEINKRFNRHISISHKRTEEENEKDLQIRTHFICVSQLEDGRCGITIATRTRLFELWNEMPKFPKVITNKWFISKNPFFNRFPRAITPKIYIIEKQTIEDNLKDAKELMIKNHKS